MNKTVVLGAGYMFRSADNQVEIYNQSQTTKWYMIKYGDNGVAYFEEIPPPCAVTYFNVGDHVEKYTGDYQIKGVVRSVFSMENKSIRYVVEHKAEGGGSFLHIYSDKNLRKIT